MKITSAVFIEKFTNNGYTLSETGKKIQPKMCRKLVTQCLENLDYFHVDKTKFNAHVTTSGITYQVEFKSKETNAIFYISLIYTNNEHNILQSEMRI